MDKRVVVKGSAVTGVILHVRLANRRDIGIDSRLIRTSYNITRARAINNATEGIVAELRKVKAKQMVGFDMNVECPAMEVVMMDSTCYYS